MNTNSDGSTKNIANALEASVRVSLDVLEIVAASQEHKKDTPFHREMVFHQLHTGLAYAEGVPLVGLAIVPIHATVSLTQSIGSLGGGLLCLLSGAITYPCSDSASKKCFKASKICLETSADGCKSLAFTLANTATLTLYGCHQTWCKDTSCLLW